MADIAFDGGGSNRTSVLAARDESAKEEMRVFVLDDNPCRIDVFKRFFSGDELVCAETYDEFLESIQFGDFDRVYLDHDLGGVFVDPYDTDEHTGYDAVKFIVENDLHKGAEYICHSLNPAGAEAMAAMLAKSGRKVAVMPFTQVWTMMDKVGGLV